MKKVLAILTVLFIFSSTFAFAGGDQNTNRHDGEEGTAPLLKKETDKICPYCLLVCYEMANGQDNIETML